MTYINILLKFVAYNELKSIKFVVYGLLMLSTLLLPRYHNNILLWFIYEMTTIFLISSSISLYDLLFYFNFCVAGQVVIDTSLPFRSNNYSKILTVSPIAVPALSRARFSVKGINLSRPATRYLLVAL